MTSKYVHPRSSQLLLLDRSYITSCLWLALQHRFWDTTTFEVNVTACNLENSFTFDNKIYITTHVHFVIYE